MKKDYFAFVGQLNTTIGKPHKKTGRHNIYGNLFKFRTRKERDYFIEHYYNQNNDAVVKTNLRHAKSRFFAGMSQREFDEYVNCYLEYRTLYDL